MSKRDRFSIPVEILETSINGATMRQIEREMCLADTLFKKYEPMLLEEGTLEKKEKIYITTEKGKNAITTYQEMMALIESKA
ncbi:MAG: winged helix-turn-helix domain-containing protein [Candidatus Aenigmatarchaeota archaeon]